MVPLPPKSGAASGSVVIVKYDYAAYVDNYFRATEEGKDFWDNECAR